MIDKPGVYDIPMAEYLADPVVQPSLTASVANCLLQKSPAHARMMHPRLFAGFEREDDSRFELGSAAHRMLLERTADGIVWVPADDWRTNAAKALRDSARQQGRLPILTKYQGVLEQMVKVANQAMQDSEFGGWPAGKPEQTLVWNEYEGMAWCRARPDWLADDRALIFDYKTCESAEPEFAIRQLSRMSYDLSAAFYLRGMSVLGHADTKYVFLFQEIEPPFACSFVALANSYLQIAEDKVARAIETWRLCLAADKWPAYRLDVHWAEPPAWMLSEYEARLDSAGRAW